MTNEEIKDKISLADRKRILDSYVTKNELLFFDKGYIHPTACYAVNRETSKLGEGTTIGKECHLTGTIIIGQNCMFGYRVIAIAEDHVFWNPPQEPFVTQGIIDKPIEIGDDVWIGAYVVITGGVKIGSHAIIGAGAIVTHNIPDWEIWAGNPAKKIGDRRTWKKF